MNDTVVPQEDVVLLKEILTDWIRREIKILTGTIPYSVTPEEMAQRKERLNKVEKLLLSRFGG